MNFRVSNKQNYRVGGVDRVSELECAGEMEESVDRFKFANSEF